MPLDFDRARELNEYEETNILEAMEWAFARPPAGNGVRTGTAT